MKHMHHELTHVYQQGAEMLNDLLDRLNKERLSTHSSLVVCMGSSSFQKKTFASALARKLSKQLYRVDLSSVSSKYIGETEKNLDAIFNRASASGWILFFDEADALFGKRTEVKDSHDRYANQESNYLLHKIERYRGIVILSTNSSSQLLKGAGRLRKIRVKFPPFS